MAQRIVVHKHYSDSSLITRDKFLSEGEIVISNESGFEGIYVLNSRGDVVKIGGSSSSGSSISEDIKQFLKENYMTSGQTVDYISSIATYLQNEIDNISGTTVSDEHISELAALEVAKIVASADSKFDTLKEIADWISSDETNSAKMANDITAISGATEDLKAYIDEQLKNIRSSDHVFLTRADYNTLVKYGVAVISGETYFYKDDVYYCIYELGQEDEGQGGIDYVVESGMIVTNDVTITDDGFVVIDAPVVNDMIDLDAAKSQTDKDEIIFDNEGNAIVNGAEVDENGFLNLDKYQVEII